MKIERFTLQRLVTNDDRFIELKTDPEGSLCFYDQVEALEARNAELLEAAKAVVERWDSPNWKVAEHTATFIHRLRAAIAKAEGGSDE